ncbi:MAG: hypothetical protein JST92_13340 [Deltaproteobacteria bacterium]|nr:hypothetical protein [Deltaproteobacteria bacterium]
MHRTAQFVKVVLASTAASLVLLVGLQAGGAFSAFSTAQAAKAQPARPAPRSAYPNRAQVTPAGIAPDPNEPSAPASVFENDSDISLGDGLSVNGQPMRLSLFVTTDQAQQVVASYSDVFLQRGLIPIAHTEGRIGHVSVFDPEDGLQRFVSALPQGDKQTLVMVGATSPTHAPHFLRGAKDAPFPVPPEHRAFLGYASDDGGQHAQSGQFVTTLSTKVLREYFRSELVTHAGFAERSDTGDAMWVFTKPGVSITVAAQQLSDKSGSAVFVNRIEGETP